MAAQGLSGDDLLPMSLRFEFTFGHYVDGKSWRAFRENDKLLDGHLWAVALSSLGGRAIRMGKKATNEAPPQDATKGAVCTPFSQGSGGPQKSCRAPAQTAPH